MKLAEAFAKSTYRNRIEEAHYCVALFEGGKFKSLVYDEYDRVPVFGIKEGADQWLVQRGGMAQDEGWDWRVISVDIVPRK